MGISEAKGIDQESFVSFITDYKTIMYRIAYGYLCNEQKALDAVDESVYLGYLHRKELRQPEFLKTWLTRILINECHQILRKSKREIIVEEIPETPDQSAEISFPVKHALQGLPEDLRKVIILRYFGGYTIAETAKTLEIPEGTVSSRTRKAFKILRVELTDQEEGGISNDRWQTELG